MNTSNPPTHEEITRRARKLWNDRGNPNGRDDAIWLEAEQQLTATPTKQPEPQISGTIEPNASFGIFLRNPSLPQSAAHSHGPDVVEPAAGPSHEGAVPTPDPLEIAAKSAIQKKSARTPRRPTHASDLKPVPTESGKPLWNQPHSS